VTEHPEESLVSPSTEHTEDPSPVDVTRHTHPKNPQIVFSNPIEAPYPGPEYPTPLPATIQAVKSTDTTFSQLGPAMDAQYHARREVRIKSPTAFNGDPTKLKGFLQQCNLVLQANEHIYFTDDQKIIYIISHCSDGSAAVWKESFLTECTGTTGTFRFPSFSDFILALQEQFPDVDCQASALYELRRIRQLNSSVCDHNAAFRVLLANSGLDIVNNARVLIEFYQASLAENILENAWSHKDPPTTVYGWMKLAQEEDLKLRQLARFTDSFRKPEPRRTLEPEVVTVRHARTSFGRYPTDELYPPEQYSPTERYPPLPPRYPSNERYYQDERYPYPQFGRYPPRICYACRQPGHLAASCPLQQHPDVKLQRLGQELSQLPKQDIQRLIGMFSKEQDPEPPTISRAQYQPSPSARRTEPEDPYGPPHNFPPISRAPRYRPSPLAKEVNPKEIDDDYNPPSFSFPRNQRDLQRLAENPEEREDSDELEESPEDDDQDYYEDF
jgi:Ty3 transposon capsid-like protein/Zinc knuckle